MSRTVPEWIGKTDDTPIPPRVKARIFGRAGEQCAVCTKPIPCFEHPEFDHIVALINGGENRESNIQVLCQNCHGRKTKADVAQKADTYAKRMAHLGFRPTSKRPMPHGKNSPTKKKFTGEVVRR